MTILEELLRRHPELPPSVRRTLERRVRHWRALHGPDQELIFAQRQPPGLLGLSDFTAATDLGVVVAGAAAGAPAVPLPAALLRLRARCRGGGRRVLQRHQWRPAAGAVDARRRVPRNTALTACRPRSATSIPPPRTIFTERYRALCEHYRMLPTRNNRGAAHENGSVRECPRPLQARSRTGPAAARSREFDDLDAYRRLIAELIGRHNARRRVRIDAERAALQPLPARRVQDFEIERVRVTSHDGFTLRKVSTRCRRG